MSEVPKLKRTAKTLVARENLNSFELFDKYSLLTRLQRVVAWCSRFVNNARPSSNCANSPLRLTELFAALNVLIKISQRESFATEIDLLTTENKLSSRSKVLYLTPFLDESGVMTVGGPLKNSNLPFNAKHPVLLHSKHRFTSLLFTEEHIRLLYVGP